jgi:YD repeat-containing protein
VTDARGNVHSYGLLTQFGLVKPATVTGVPVQSAGGQAFTYDSNGFIASSTDWNGNVTTYTHDAQGNETSRVRRLARRRPAP